MAKYRSTTSRYLVFCITITQIIHSHSKPYLYEVDVMSHSETGFVVSAHRLTKITLLTLIAAL